MLGQDSVEGLITHFNNCSIYYGINEGNIILEELHKLCKQHTAYLKELHQRNEKPTKKSQTNSINFEIGQPAMVKNHAHHTFKASMYWNTRY